MVNLGPLSDALDGAWGVAGSLAAHICQVEEEYPRPKYGLWECPYCGVYHNALDTICTGCGAIGVLGETRTL